MFVAVYRWRLKPGFEAQFRKGWCQITEAARAQCGSGGSALFKAEDGTWVAIARWPDRETRTACFTGGVIDPQAVAIMNEAIDERFPDLELDVVDDLWAPFPPP